MSTMTTTRPMLHLTRHDLAVLANSGDDAALAEWQAREHSSETEPCGCPAGAHDDGEPGGFYATVQDGKRTGWLLGPYATHTEALERVHDARNLARAANSRAYFYAFGTARIVDGPRPAGVLNDRYTAWRAAMLPAGTLVQYRKVGRGTVVTHACYSPQSCAEMTRSHRYEVAFETGRYRGTTVDVWLDPDDVTTRPGRKAQR